MLKLAGLLCILLVCNAGFRLVNHDNDDGHEHLNIISDPTLTYFDVFYTSMLGDLGILPSDSLKCFTTTGQLILNYLPVLQSYAAAVTQFNQGSIEVGLLSSQYLLSQLSSTTECFMGSNDYASIANKLGWGDQKAMIPSYLMNYFYSAPFNVQFSLNSVVSSLNANNYPVAGVNAANQLKFIANSINSYGPGYYSGLAIYNGVIQTLQIANYAFCLNNVSGDSLTSFFMGWGNIAQTASQSSFYSESQQFLLYGDGNKYLRALNQTDTCWKNQYKDSFNANIIFTETFADYALAYIQANPDVQTQMALLSNFAANPYLLSYSVIGPLIQQVLGYAQINIENGKNPQYQVTIFWSQFTQFLNTLWENFGLSQSQVQNCFQPCSGNSYQLSAVVGNWYFALSGASKYNPEFEIYYSNLNNEGSCQNSITCALGTSDVQNLLEKAGIPSMAALNQYLLSQPQPWYQNLTNAYYALEYNGQFSAQQVANALQNISLTLNSDPHALFVYEFYSYIAVNIETNVPSGFWQCYNNLQADNDYTMWSGFAQAIKNGGSSRTQVIQNLYSYWNSGGATIWGEFLTIWEYCPTLEYYLYDYVVPNFYWNFAQSNFTSFVNQSLYELPADRFWNGLNNFQNGILENDPEMAAQGVTDFLVWI